MVLEGLDLAEHALSSRAGRAHLDGALMIQMGVKKFLWQFGNHEISRVCFCRYRRRSQAGF